MKNLIRKINSWVRRLFAPEYIPLIPLTEEERKAVVEQIGIASTTGQIRSLSFCNHIKLYKATEMVGNAGLLARAQKDERRGKYIITIIPRQLFIRKR